MDKICSQQLAGAMLTFASPSVISVLVVTRKHMPPSLIWDLLAFLALPEGISFCSMPGQICTICNHFAPKGFSVWKSRASLGSLCTKKSGPKRSLGAQAEREKLQEVTKKWIKWERKELAWLEAQVASNKNVFPSRTVKNGRKNCADSFPTPQSHVKTCALILSTSKRMVLSPVCKLSYCTHIFPKAKIVLGLPRLLPLVKQTEGEKKAVILPSPQASQCSASQRPHRNEAVT